jgi:hypothetical protein
MLGNAFAQMRVSRKLLNQIRRKLIKYWTNTASFESKSVFRWSRFLMLLT